MDFLNFLETDCMIGLFCSKLGYSEQANIRNSHRYLPDSVKVNNFRGDLYVSYGLYPTLSFFSGDSVLFTDIPGRSDSDSYNSTGCCQKKGLLLPQIRPCLCHD